MPGPCPACASHSSVEHGRVDELRLALCGVCGLVFSDPAPRDEVERRYLDEYDLGEHFQTWSDRKRILFTRRLERLPSPGTGRDRLCDVGCADGQFLDLAAARGWSGEGVELNPPAAAAARKRGFEVHEGALERLEGLDWGGFDIVTAWDVLEHTPDPRPFAEALARLVAPGGAMVLTTLNRRSLVSRAFGLRWSMIGEDHFTYWNGSSLARLLDGVGLEVQGISSFGVGRGFFKWADRLQRRVRRTGRDPDPAPEPSKHYSGQSGAASWDTSPAVLAAESGVNRLLGAVGGGLELYAVTRKRG